MNLDKLTDILINLVLRDRNISTATNDDGELARQIAALKAKSGRANRMGT